MKIGLMGFDFSSPNKGCEALTYSFINILKEFSILLIFLMADSEHFPTNILIYPSKSEDQISKIR